MRNYIGIGAILSFITFAQGCAGNEPAGEDEQTIETTSELHRKRRVPTVTISAQITDVAGTRIQSSELREEQCPSVAPQALPTMFYNDVFFFHPELAYDGAQYSANGTVSCGDTVEAQGYTMRVFTAYYAYSVERDCATPTSYPDCQPYLGYTMTRDY